MFRKKSLGTIPVDPKLVRRASMMSIEELFNWADTTLSGVINQFRDYRGDRDPLHLQEAKLGTEVFFALLDEMSGRSPGVPPTRRARQVAPRRRIT